MAAFVEFVAPAVAVGTDESILRFAKPSSFLFLRIDSVVSVRRRRPSRVSTPFLKSALRVSKEDNSRESLGENGNDHRDT